jgi:hypothetical protein
MKKIEPFLLKLGRTIARKDKAADRKAPIPVLAGALAASDGGKLKPEVVYNWCHRDTIPYRWRPFVAQIAVRENIALPKILSAYAPSKGAVA